MAAGDLTNVADVEGAGGIVASAPVDAAVGRLITAGSEWIRQITGRDFGLGALSYSEIRDGSGGTELLLRDGPATSISSLAVGAVPIPAQVADGQPGYFLANGATLLCLSGYRFTRGRKNVRVAYLANAGTPVDVAQACLEIVLAAYRRQKNPEMQTETMPASGAVISFKLSDIPAAAKCILQQRTRVAPV